MTTSGHPIAGVSTRPGRHGIRPAPGSLILRAGGGSPSLRRHASSPARIREIAHHESGHALVHWLYGHALEYVSIRPGRAYDGVVRTKETDPLDTDRFDPGRPVQGQPPELRAAIERSLIASLAGDVAAELAALHANPTGWGEPSEAASTAALEALPSRSRELIVEVEAAESIASDAERVAGLAKAWTGRAETAGPYVAWLRSEAESLCWHHWPAITRLAEALIARPVIDGVEAVRIMRGDPPRCPSHPAGTPPASVKET